MNIYKKEKSVWKHTYHHFCRVSIIAIIAIITFTIPALAHAEATNSVCDEEPTTQSDQTEQDVKRDITPEQDYDFETESNPQPDADDTESSDGNLEAENSDTGHSENQENNESEEPEDEGNNTESNGAEESDSGNTDDSSSDNEGSEEDESGNVDPSESDVDKSALQALYDEGKQLNPEDYTSDSYKNFKENGLDGAENTLNNKDATQADIDGMIKSFNLYLSQLVEAEVEEPEKSPEEDQEEAEESKLDTSKMESLLTQAKELNPEEYTDGTFDQLNKYINQAESVLENKTSTQEYVDTISASLKNELNHLTTVQQLKTESSENEESSQPGMKTVEKDQKSKTKENETSENEAIVVSNPTQGPGQPLPKTAMNTGTLMLVGSVLIMTGGLALLIRRKKVTTQAV